MRLLFIADLARYHDIFRYVCDDICPSERLIQRYRREYEYYFEVFLQMTLKRLLMNDSQNLITLLLMRTIKKVYNSNNNTITKKETQILVDYYE